MPADHQRISALLINPDDVARAGMRALLVDDPDFTILGDAVADGVHLARRLRPRLILLEPDIAGVWDVNLIRDLLEASPDSCIFIYTAVTAPGPFLDAMHAGARAYLLKGSASGAFLRDALRLVGRFGAAVVDAALVDRFREEVGDRLTVIQTELEGHALSDRERQILGLLAAGYTNAAIARRLGVAANTVGSYVERLKEKLDAQSRAELVGIAVRHGLPDA